MRSFIGFLCLFVAMNVHGQNLELSAPSFHKSFSLEELKSQFKSEVITIKDPVFKKTLKYDGIALSELLKLMVPKEGEAPSEILFGSKDGYAPTLAFQKVQDYEGYVVYAEHVALAPGQKSDGIKTTGLTRKIPEKPTQNAAPFYVVWKKSSKTKELPWVYQLIKIESIDWNHAFASLIPKDAKTDSPEMHGLALYRNYCIRCHAIDGKGGKLGPDFGGAANPTLHGDLADLKSFIHDAPAILPKTQMPSFNFLNDGDVDRLVRYLQAMKAL